MANQLLFQVYNQHAPASGQAPYIDANTPNRYHAYFENAYGEQLILACPQDLYHSLS
jgi:hypothetical protein